jgi:hypothetical protein
MRIKFIRYRRGVNWFWGATKFRSNAYFINPPVGGVRQKFSEAIFRAIPEPKVKKVGLG